MIEKLNTPPISGDYQEIIFDLPGPWKTTFWNYVKFTKQDGTEWCGCFREQDNRSFKVAELESKGIVCVISGGHGYIIDIENAKKIKDLENEGLVDVYVDKKTNSFYVAKWHSLHHINSELEELDIIMPFSSDGIEFKKVSARKLNMEVMLIGADMIKSNDYYIDLDEKKVRSSAYKKISNYKNFHKLNENDRLSKSMNIRLLFDSKFRHNYVMPTRSREKIISYSEHGIFNDAFMIGHISDLDGKRVFILVYIHSFKKGCGTKILLTYLNKNNIKNISYVPNSSFQFWAKISNICDNNNIVLRQPFQQDIEYK